MDIVLLVQWIELSQAAAKMNEAMEVYNNAISAVKAAAADLASKWEGDAKEAFVRNQDEAYRWYSTMHNVVIEIINLVKRVIEIYRNAENQVKGVIQG